LKRHLKHDVWVTLCASGSVRAIVFLFKNAPLICNLASVKPLRLLQIGKASPVV